ncbi:DUF5908 family protein [Algibacter miyuki]|uniref:DUF5908 family protein n=1 Tax=Algibacter miyuki TaxID=1306933 RepID=A0ABV5H506_9FLAO|nr:DUF5908 family protein [Algibacter miyuki]MDN3663816.1 hypothetical protein [Algibacter miyuki]
MALIVKEIIIRGIVTKNPSLNSEASFNKDDLESYLEDFQKSIKKDCVDTVFSKLESRKIR